jgi:hypothetical protein
MPPDDATASVVAQFPGVRYIVEKCAELDFARNRAWVEAHGEWIAYLDDDVTVDRWWFEGLQEAWRENQEASAFTGLVMPLELSSPAQVLFERRDGFRRGFDKRRYAASLPENPLYPCGAGIFGAGCNMAFRRDFLREPGGFDNALDTGASLPGGGDLESAEVPLKASTNARGRGIDPYTRCCRAGSRGGRGYKQGRTPWHLRLAACKGASPARRAAKTILQWSGGWGGRSRAGLSAMVGRGGRKPLGDK